MTAFSLSDSTGVAGLTLNNITNTGNLALSISSDRADGQQRQHRRRRLGDAGEQRHHLWQQLQRQLAQHHHRRADPERRFGHGHLRHQPAAVRQRRLALVQRPRQPVGVEQQEPDAAGQQRHQLGPGQRDQRLDHPGRRPLRHAGPDADRHAVDRRRRQRDADRHPPTDHAVGRQPVRQQRQRPVLAEHHRQPRQQRRGQRGAGGGQGPDVQRHRRRRLHDDRGQRPDRPELRSTATARCTSATSTSARPTP